MSARDFQEIVAYKAVIEAEINAADRAQALLRSSRIEYLDTIADIIVSRGLLRLFTWRYSSDSVATLDAQGREDGMTPGDFVRTVIPIAQVGLKNGAYIAVFSLDSPETRKAQRANPHLIDGDNRLEARTGLAVYVRLIFSSLSNLHEFAVAQKLEVDYSELVDEYRELAKRHHELERLVLAVTTTPRYIPQG